MTSQVMPMTVMMPPTTQILKSEPRSPDTNSTHRHGRSHKTTMRQPAIVKASLSGAPIERAKGTAEKMSRETPR